MILDAIFEPNLFTIRRYGVGPKDPLGKPTRVLLSTVTANGILQQTGTAEGEAFVVDKFRSTMPIGTDLRVADEVECKGKLYTVEGTPFSTTVPRTPSIGIVTAVLKFVGLVSA